MNRQVRVWPATPLKEPCTPVENPLDDDVQSLILDMKEVVQKSRAEGLAANQVGVQKRILIFHTYSSGRKPVVLINPEIYEASEETIVSKEGCLSFPGVRANVKRHADICVKALDETGEEIRLALEGIESICLQHEVDHLDGKTFLDKVGRTERRMLLKGLKKFKRKYRIE